MARIPRIYQPIHQSIQAGSTLILEGNTAHYLVHVLRLNIGAPLLVFSEAVGEWSAEIASTSKKTAEVVFIRQMRAPEASPDIWLLFAPVKNEKIDFIAKRATELGVSAIQPIQTKRTIVNRVNEERLVANMVEAAEQSERLDVPKLLPFLPLEKVLSNWNQARILFFADESGAGQPIHSVLPTIARGMPAAVIIGPEGGFSKEEHGILRNLPYIKPITLGPRILRAETAALTALAHVQAWIGDGDKLPHFEQET
jgi:16S rRNA (uracil1498-N3)-methyltransferase